MEQVKHIKGITVENFKCFDHFSVSDFGMYNIILGDNNVGKTSFLESLLFDENINQSISNLQGVLHYKRMVFDNDFEIFNSINPLNFFINRINSKNYLEVSVFYFNGNQFITRYQTEKLENLNDEERKKLQESINYGSRDKEILRATNNTFISEFRSFNVNQNIEGYDVMMPIMSPSLFYGKDLIQYYSDNFTGSKDKKKNLISQLKVLIPNIIDIELTYTDSLPVIGVWLNNSDSLLPLPMFGDGTIRLFRMIMEITVSKNKYLCIDEIDTGIHYSKYKDFSRIVLATAAANNVQLFISTHNNEFLKSFKEVLEEKDFASYQEQTKCFTLKKLPKGDIKAYRYDFEEFEFAIEQENELR